MHDTVVKVRKRVRTGEPRENPGAFFSMRLQEAGLTRAMSDPLSAHLELLYLEAFRWTGLSDRAVSGEEGNALIEIYHASRHLHVVLGELVPFLERAEDVLSEREDVTYRESGYEREVAPFSRLDSIRGFRDLLAGKEGFTLEGATLGAQAEADLLKVVYLEGRLDVEVPKSADLYAMVVELLLDARRHLEPAFADGSPFLTGLKKVGSAG